MTPDSAWRQWKGAVRGQRDAETRLAEARAVWLQTMLEGFEERRRIADADGHDVTSKDALIALGVPCVDCLTPAPKGAGHKIVNGREGMQYQLYASCGKAAVDPTALDKMPELFHVPV